MPSLFIITGSNGAGKSTIGPDYLPKEIQQSCRVFDGDKLFMEKQRELWKTGIRAYKEAKKLAFSFVEETFDSLVDNAITNKIDFVYEGHFTNEETWKIPLRFQSNGYSINLIFFGLRDTDLSELRVINRTKEGGHYVDPITLAANFNGNLEKLDIHFSMFDILQIIDTSETEHKVLCVLKNGKVSSAINVKLLPNWFKTYLPHIVDKVEENQKLI